MRDSGVGAPALPDAVDRRIEFTADDKVRQALARLGRTEDVQFSPSGDRVAIVAFHENRILILGVEPVDNDDRLSINLTGPLELRSRSFFNPHGISWIDERTIVVANRSAQLEIYEIPDKHRSGRVELTPVKSFGSEISELLKTPGSVSAVAVGLDLIELVIANNYVNHVSRHLIDRRKGYEMVASEVLAHDGLDVPDGVEFSQDGKWIAISNHNHQKVLLFRNGGFVEGPQATLTGVKYPHGLHFAEGGRSLLVADAGAPFVHLYRSCGEWSGEIAPDASFRAMSDEIHKKGSINPTEGGPKGVDVTDDGSLMVTTCHEQPLAFFDMRNVLMSQPERDPSGDVPDARDVLLRYMASARTTMDEETAAIRRAMDFELAVVTGSRSWRITRPLRWGTAMLRWIAPGWSARHLQ